MVGKFLSIEVSIKYFATLQLPFTFGTKNEIDFGKAEIRS